MAKAYSYIRFSTPEQLKGDSLRRQAEASRKYAADYNLDLDESLNLRDLGVSAFDSSNIKRGALGKFLQLVQDGTIQSGSYLLVENLDRISRGQITDAIELFIQIINSGIIIVTLMDSQIYSRESINANMSNLFASIAIMSRAGEESLTKSRRIRASWVNKKSNVENRRLTKRCPYWLAPTEDGKFCFIQERKETLQYIIDMARDGAGNTVITKILNEKGIPTFSKTTDGWQPSYIQKMLTSHALYGALRLRDTDEGGKSITRIVENYYPAIMTRDEWMYLASVRVARTTKGGFHKGNNLSNLFSGLLICGHCSGPMVMGAHTKYLKNGKKSISRWVGCSRGRRGHGCKHISWNYYDLEATILQFCKSIDFESLWNKDDSSDRRIKELQNRSGHISSSLDAHRTKLNNLLIFIEEGNITEVNVVSVRIRELTHIIENLHSEKVKIDNEILRLRTELASKRNTPDAINRVLSEWNKDSDAEVYACRLKLANLVRQAISHIRLYPGGNWLSETKKKELKTPMKESGYSELEINSYFSQFSELNKCNKFLTIIFTNQESVRITPQGILHNFREVTLEEYLNTSL